MCSCTLGRGTHTLQIRSVVCVFEFHTQQQTEVKEWRTEDYILGGTTLGPALEISCEDSQLTGAAIAQLAARRSHNPKVVSSILTRRIFRKNPNSRTGGY